MREITREMESMEPDGAMFDLLATVDLDSLCTDQLVTLAILARKMKSGHTIPTPWTQAAKAVLA